jgi:4-alpha-glucanotransferase
VLDLDPRRRCGALRQRHLRRTNINSMDLDRSSGVLLHPTSLPGGRIGREAYRFVDWLAHAGQSWWQVLPLGPPDEQRSPYNAASAFAAPPALVAEPDAPVPADEMAEFRERQAYWLGDYLRLAGDGALAEQVRFEREWSALRSYAARNGVRLIGDVPIFVSRTSVDVRSHPELFLDDVVAGVPPDYFSATGQLWGSAIYDWPALRRTGYRWWVERFARSFEHVDVVRIDHFRGFVASWAVPAGARTARRGRWRRGPGATLFRAVEETLGPLSVIAEDLGVITPAVTRLRDALGFPGMRVLQFGLEGGSRSPHRVENHPDWSVVYTGTHDNDTAVGWWSSLSEQQRLRTGLDPREPHWSLIRLALASRARLAVVPAQDVLGLGSEARMNTPGQQDGNWSWRLEPGQLTEELAARLREETRQAQRLPR